VHVHTSLVVTRFAWVTKQKVFEDGDDVCVIYDLKTAPVPSSRTCEWYRVRDGKVASVSVVFDARPFAPLFGARPGD
jgi:hypothetical protein